MGFLRHTILVCLVLSIVSGSSMAAGRIVRGHIRPAAGETRLPEAITVTLDGPGVHKTTFALGGSFSFDGVPGGTHVVTVRARGHEPSAVVVKTDGLQGSFPVSVVLGRSIGDRQTLPEPGSEVVDVQTLGIPEEAREAFQEAVKHISENKITEAEKGLKRAIDEYPDFYQAHLALGSVYARSKRLSEAQEEFAKAVAIQPESKLAQRNLGVSLLLQERPTEAIEPLLAATRLDPSDPRAFSLLGEAYFHSRQWDKAEEVFQDSLRIDPTSYEVIFRLGEISFQKRDLKTALAYFRQTLDRNPPDNVASAARSNIEKLESLAAAAGRKPLPEK